MKIDLIMDLQYGSTGKGLLAGYLAETTGHDGVATCNMPNAGHTYIDKQNNIMIHKVLPNGIVSPNLTSVFIGPGAVFDPERLDTEIDLARSMGYLETACVYIHPNAMILEESHRKMEQDALSGIASTMQGSMAASLEKMIRDPDNRCIAKYKYIPNRDRVYVLSPEEWMQRVSSCHQILAEGSQGFSLGLNQRFWPYCTSRECTPYRMISDMGLPQRHVETWGTLRTYPIRVGNTPDGYSGDHYDDQSELSWEELGQAEEYTTVTGRVRRVFTFSRLQLAEALWHCRPDHLFLNFCNYMTEDDLGRLTDDIDSIAHEYVTGIRLCGYGPAFGDVKPYNPRQAPSIEC